MKKFVAIALATLGLSYFALTPAAAQTWPQKPIRVIVPFPAGGGTDVVARMVADHLSKLLGQPIFVENRGGANGAVGLQALKQSDPDGYTLGFTSDTPMTVNPWLYKDLSYDPLKDFVPVASAVRLPGMLAANPSLPANTIAELIALAKQKPDGLAYGSAGIGNFSHLAMVLFTQATGVKMLHVPYKGTGPMAMGIIGGEVQVEFNNVSTLLPFVKDGKLKALAVAEPKRMAKFPDWPAVAETVRLQFEAGIDDLRRLAGTEQSRRQLADLDAWCLDGREGLRRVKPDVEPVIAKQGEAVRHRNASGEAQKISADRHVVVREVDCLNSGLLRQQAFKRSTPSGHR